MEAVLTRWREIVQAASANRTGLRLRGGGSKDFYGESATGELFDTRDYRGIVGYEPTELVVTARCGTPLAELEAALAERGQMLAFEPPGFGDATVGGCLAAGLSGPRRAQAGPLRDFVLGTRLMDGRGRIMEFGGQVMKNVAGYDISRLLAGSMGILGLVLEVSFKVLPRPIRETSLHLSLSQEEALTAVTRWRRQPLPVSATAWEGGELTVRLSGAEAAVATAARTLGGTILEDREGERFWRDLREQQLAFFGNGDVPLWRISVPANTGVLPIEAADILLEWHGTQRWLRTDMPANEVRLLAREAGGHATLFRGGERADIFEPLPEPVMALHQRLKAQFDPDGIFNPGRLYRDL